MPRFRNSAKAVIIEDNRLLAIQNTDVLDRYHTLPGGGQRPFETLTDALKRECTEELGVRVEVGDLLFIREYIGKNHEFAEKDGDAHQIEFYFRCDIIGETGDMVGEIPDKTQTGVEWLELDRLDHHRLYPKVLCDLLKAGGLESKPAYLGDVN